MSSSYSSSSRRSRKYHVKSVGKTVFTIDERYKNLKPVGSGSYGVVASADDELTGQKVAIKKVPNVFEDLVDAKRILRELKLLRHLDNHENIVAILDIMTLPPDTDDFKDLYIVTDCFECDLDRIISSKQALTDGHFQYFLYQILRAMKFVHSANVLHRDLKPSNLLVNANCDLAVCDFGLARGVSSELDAELTEYVVTRWYRAPELLCDNQTYGKAIDIWSIGCIFAEILQRKPLLCGKDYLHQLKLITKLLGKPSREDLVFIQNKSARDAIGKLDYPSSGTNFKHLFEDANPLAIDLLKKMLKFNPSKRCSIEEALNHPYLEDLNKELESPECYSIFNFDFEKDYPDEMPKNVIQRIMIDEMKCVTARYSDESMVTLPPIVIHSNNNSNDPNDNNYNYNNNNNNNSCGSIRNSNASSYTYSDSKKKKEGQSYTNVKYGSDKHSRIMSTNNNASQPSESNDDKLSIV